MNEHQPIRVVVTGAAGHIGYALIFKIANGDLFGPNRKIRLHLLEIDTMQERLEGVRMEVEDCAFDCVDSVHIGSDPRILFDQVHCAFLVGAKPRGPGQERKDLLFQNAAIFSEQGRALNEVADRDVKVLVIGNPANSNALITAHHAPLIPASNITAMSRLDHNRMVSMAAAKLGCDVIDIHQACVWGNHSPTMFPDLSFALYQGKKVLDQVDRSWYEKDMIPAVQNRGATVIKARGSSSAASAAHAALMQMRDWITPLDSTWRSMIVCSDGSYGVDAGLFSSFPVHAGNGKYSIISDLKLDRFADTQIQNSISELREERNMISDLI